MAKYNVSECWDTIEIHRFLCYSCKYVNYFTDGSYDSDHQTVSCWNCKEVSFLADGEEDWEEGMECDVNHPDYDGLATINDALKSFSGEL